MNDILTTWKENVQLSKWVDLKTNVPEYQNSSIDRLIKVFRSFFHEEDLSEKSLRMKNHIVDIDPSEYWLHFILSQKNPGSIFLVYELEKVIKFYQKRNIEYLKHKLLKNNGRIDRRSFRDKYFEVFFNYNLERSGIKVEFEKCYRNKLNKDDEGFDSLFQFKGQNYVIECLKIKSWQEYQHSAAYKIIQILAKELKKNPKYSNLLPLSIFAKTTTPPKQIDPAFKSVLKTELGKGEILQFDKLTGFDDLQIFPNSEIQNLTKANSKFLKEYIRINVRLRNLKYLDKSDIDIGIDFSKAHTERHEYEISSHYKTINSPTEFENHLLKKINKKISQLNKSNCQKKILAIEFEAYPGFGNFPIKIDYRFKKILEKVHFDLTIILFFKDSKSDNVYLNKKSFFDKNDPFMKYLIYGKLF